MNGQEMHVFFFLLDYIMAADLQTRTSLLSKERKKHVLEERIPYNSKQTSYWDSRSLQNTASVAQNAK